MAEALRKTPGVHGVEVNERTGSVLVHHEEQIGIFEAVEKSLAESSGELLEVLIEGGNPEVAGLALVGHFLHNLVSSADDQLAGATNNAVDLKTIAPLAFLTAGILRFRRGLGQGEDLLMSVSPIVFFWYAFDLYWRFNIVRPGLQAVEHSQVSQTKEPKRISKQS
jgi:hypothetical protein